MVQYITTGADGLEYEVDTDTGSRTPLYTSTPGVIGDYVDPVMASEFWRADEGDLKAEAGYYKEPYVLHSPVFVSGPTTPDATEVVSDPFFGGVLGSNAGELKGTPVVLALVAVVLLGGLR